MSDFQIWYWNHIEIIISYMISYYVCIILKFLRILKVRNLETRLVTNNHFKESHCKILICYMHFENEPIGFLQNLETYYRTNKHFWKTKYFQREKNIGARNLYKIFVFNMLWSICLPIYLPTYLTIYLPIYIHTHILKFS